MSSRVIFALLWKKIVMRYITNVKKYTSENQGNLYNFMRVDWIRGCEAMDKEGWLRCYRQIFNCTRCPCFQTLHYSRVKSFYMYSMCIYLMIKDDSLESLTAYPVMWFSSQFVQTCLPISCLTGRKLQWNKLFNIIICNTIKKQSSECYL